MILKELREEVCKANLDLVAYGLVIFTWGNVSAIDRDSNLIVIKPSGVSYENMTAKDMVVVDLDGNIIDGIYKPSSDTPTHLELYKAFSTIGAIVHTHSTWATSFAQSGREIPVFGTTHADHFLGAVPCTRSLTFEEVNTEYEKNTGKVIVETLRDIEAENMPSILVKNHGPFSWGSTADKAVYNAKTLEEMAKMAFLTLSLGNDKQIEEYLLKKHFYRKHGKNSYYGQKGV
ncbi:L-ribulose-5-phosphate 4-epimerase [Aliarcobacter skirrowii]|uniref:L-ribulose-5-phosphate 4-epimerase n=1 Tax=Aliarcobacter skirrowii TaxID=28200 RepID=UPI0021B31521|nr:L-ribulose-5-phosphate 4-epimerase [Aliarcobacter skirrowii]MCT7447016.1 L-ribulose-5-phosphate 4-epimerase [Aliarcobacter skirrowii]